MRVMARYRCPATADVPRPQNSEDVGREITRSGGAPTFVGPSLPSRHGPVGLGRHRSSRDVRLRRPLRADRRRPRDRIGSRTRRPQPPSNKDAAPIGPDRKQRPLTIARRPGHPSVKSERFMVITQTRVSEEQYSDRGSQPLYAYTRRRPCGTRLITRAFATMRPSFRPCDQMQAAHAFTVSQRLTGSARPRRR